MRKANKVGQIETGLNGQNGSRIKDQEERIHDQKG